jgi:hypothetical protein
MARARCVRWVLVWALPGVMAAGFVGCASTTGPTPGTAQTSLHVIGRQPDTGLKVVSSYTVDSGTGLLSLVETQALETGYPGGGFIFTGLLAGDPQGRFLYVATSLGVRSYAINPASGALTLVSQVPIAHAVPRPPSYPDGLTRLSATGEYLYLLGGWYRLGSRTRYERLTLAVDAQGVLDPRVVVELGLDGFNGPAMLRMIADPGARILYQQRGEAAVRASQIRPDGTLEDLAEAALPRGGQWWDTHMALARGALVVAGAGGDLISLQLDRDGGALQARTYLPGAGSSLLPFGATGRLLVGNYDNRTFTLCEVGPSGQLRPGPTLPDPQRYYSGEDGTMAFSPSGRFFYSARESSVWVFAVGLDGQLSALQVLGLPGVANLRLALTPSPSAP